WPEGGQEAWLPARRASQAAEPWWPARTDPAPGTLRAARIAPALETARGSETAQARGSVPIQRPGPPIPRTALVRRTGLVRRAGLVPRVRWPSGGIAAARRATGRAAARSGLGQDRARSRPGR